VIPSNRFEHRRVISRLKKAILFPEGDNNKRGGPMKRLNNRKKRNNQSISFKPSRQDIESAVDDFLKSGGKIKKVVVNERTYKDFVALNELPSAADDFLNDIK
jgi:hypothetical protein